MATAEVGSSPRRITIDRTTHLAQQPSTGHNRWHPHIEPVLEVEPGEVVVCTTHVNSRNHSRELTVGDRRMPPA